MAHVGVLGVLFEHSSPSSKAWAVVVTLVVTMLGSLLQRGALRAIAATGGPGIVALELAGSDAASREVLAAWGQSGRQAARRSLPGDAVFALGYSAGLALLCALVADPLSRAATPWLGTTFRWVAGLALMAGFSDVVEDVLLRFLVRGYETSATVEGNATGARSGGVAKWVRWAAMVKFASVAATIAALLLFAGPTLAMSGAG